MRIPDRIYFGCRHERKDFLFEGELKSLCSSTGAKRAGVGEPPVLSVAFSRDQPEKIYVQHLILRDGEEIWKILDPAQGNGRIIISGSSQGMPQEVRSTLRHIVCEYGGCPDQRSAEKYLKLLERQDRLCVECW